MAHAKLTWNLEILGRREDGLHELRSEMTTIGLHDVLFVDESGDHLEILNPFSMEVATDETNLVMRALQTRRSTSRRARREVDPGRRGARWRQRRRRGHPSLGRGSVERTGRHARRRRAVLPTGRSRPRRGRRRAAQRTCPTRSDHLTLIVPGLRRLDRRSPTGPTTRCAPTAGHRRVRITWRSQPDGSSRDWRRTLAWLRAEIGPDVQLAGSGSSMFVEGHLSSTESRWDMTGPEGPLQLSTLTTTPR